MPSFKLWRDLRSYYRGCQDRELREFYDLESRLPYFDHVSLILCAHKRRLLLQWISQGPVRGPILEVGSGIGTFARQLSRRGHRVLAVDISPAKTLKARHLTARKSARKPLPVSHLVGDLRELYPGTDLVLEIQNILRWPALQEFEVLVAADVLEHVPDPPHETVRRLRDVLAPHGRFFTSVPSRLCRHDPGHFWTLLPHEWEHVFTETGFHIQRRYMSRLCWYGLPTPLPLAMVYELHPIVEAHQRSSTDNG